MLRRAGLRSPVVAARSGKGRDVILLLSVVCIVYLCFSGLCVFQRLRLSLCTCGSVYLRARVFVSPSACRFLYLSVYVLAGPCACQFLCLFLRARVASLVGYLIL